MHATKDAPQQDTGPLRLLLINLAASAYPMLTAPLALATLGGTIREQFSSSVRLDYFDEQIEPFPVLVSMAAKNRYDMIGLSAQIGTSEGLWRVLDVLRKYSPKTTIVVGNVTATYGYPEILRKYPEVVCCIGRGEATIAALIRNLLTSGHALSPTAVSSIAIAGSDGSVRESLRHELLAPVSDVSVDWAGLFNKYPASNYEEFWVEASRGCPQKRNSAGCTYCAILPDGGSRDWKPRSLATVVADIVALSDARVRHVRFADEEFMANQPHRSLEFAQLVGAKLAVLSSAGADWSMTFDVAMRVDDIVRLNSSHDAASSHGNLPAGWSSNALREKALRQLKMAGMRQIYLGIESGSDRQLRRMRKGTTARGNSRALTVSRNLGIQNACGWIMLDPLMEDSSEILANADFIRHHELLPTSPSDDFVTNPIARARVLRGAPLANQLRDRGLLGALRPNLIEYEFEYLDTRISAIAASLERWELESDPAAIYRAKSTISTLNHTGGIGSSVDPEYVDAYFGLKELDLRFCEYLATHVTADKGDPSRSHFPLPRSLLQERDRFLSYLSRG